MTRKLLMAAGAAALLGLGTMAATAKPGGGPGGGMHFGGGGGPGMHFNGGGAGMHHGGPGFGAGFAGHPRGPNFAAGNWHGGNWHGHHHFRRGFGFGIYTGVPYYGYYGGYGYGCGWLYRRAVYTGSRYWWRRYEDCVGYY